MCVSCGGCSALLHGFFGCVDGLSKLGTHTQRCSRGNRHGSVNNSTNQILDYNSCVFNKRNEKFTRNFLFSIFSGIKGKLFAVEKKYQQSIQWLTHNSVLNSAMNTNTTDEINIKKKLFINYSLTIMLPHDVSRLCMCFCSFFSHYLMAVIADG